MSSFTPILCVSRRFSVFAAKEERIEKYKGGVSRLSKRRLTARDRRRSRAVSPFHRFPTVAADAATAFSRTDKEIRHGIVP